MAVCKEANLLFLLLLLYTGRIEARLNMLLVDVVCHPRRETHHHTALGHHTHVDQVHRRLHLAVPEAVDPIPNQTHKPGQPCEGVSK